MNTLNIFKIVLIGLSVVVVCAGCGIDDAKPPTLGASAIICEK